MGGPSDARSRLVAEADRCVACGLCVPQCPSYRVARSEADSPRGRIHIMRAMLEGALPAGAGALRPLDRCLGCGQCESACPNGVRFGALMDGTRRELGLRTASRTARLLARIAASPAALRALAPALGLLRTRAGDALLRRGLLAKMRLPPVPKSGGLPGGVWGEHPVRDPAGTAHVFLGCFARLLDGETISATLTLVRACGYAAVVPEGQACCGSLARQVGLHDLADDLAKRNEAAFAGAELVLCSATGCVEGAGATDVCAFVHDRGGALRFRPSGATVVLHEPCTARNSPQGAPPVGELLRRVPDTTVVRIGDSASCCGAAGSYHMREPGIAGELRDGLAREILGAMRGSDAPRLVTGNYGCGMHLAAALAEKGAELRVQHPVSFLAEHLEDGAARGG